MISGFIVKKGPMKRIFLEDGKQVTVTTCQAGPLKITQVKSQEKDGYQSIQVAYGTRRSVKKPIQGKLKKAKLDISPRGFQEFSLVASEVPSIGSEIEVSTVLSVGDTINVTGISKGRGFSGVIKRHGFHRQPVTRGQSDRTRAPGSIGAQTPGKVVKGKKMPGHYGNHQITVKGLKIINIDTENNLLTLSGSIPGPVNSWLTISKK